MSSSTRRGMLGLALVIPSFLILLVVVIIPILYAVKESLIDQRGTGYGLANYIRLFTEPAMRKNIIYTINVTLVSTALTLVISYALAIYLRFGKGVVVKWIGRLYFIPMFVPGVIATYAIITMYGNHGWAARLLLPFGIETIPRIIYDYKGLVLANLWFNIPFATMLLSSALASIPNAVIESAKDAGASLLQLFGRFILPLSYKTMWVAVTFIFMGIMGSFTAPFLIGANSPQVLGVAMQQVFSSFQETHTASAMAVFMFLLCSFMGYFYIRTMVKDADVG
ncbi:ABC transporter permease subunit [Paenibacillus sp. CMAA1739]|uniref:ABC transporter permease n=1 Tax=Paenibacillus ottowii TaxID=2315729 RepID=UPI002731A4FD|nr:MULTISPECIES: ABC transporter permease subunit [Paenibacillus]MDP1510711.1 ABC transporter permease subunit [Paenibacillus ottowii]MEC4566131.1 ABC transporter permease subunit [Paenibacillus sp. CMAA1739]